MKKFLPYLIGTCGLLLLIAIALQAPFHRSRKLDERITLRQHDKIPYGMYVAQRMVQATFSKAHVRYDKAMPGYWDGINIDTSNQAVFLISKNFDPAIADLKTITQFIQQGNYVFLITQNISDDAAQFFGFKSENGFFPAAFADTLQVSLTDASKTARSYIYPGKQYDNFFSFVDTATMRTLGRNGNGQRNFIQLQSGPGKLFIHLAPLAFSNYFLLHKDNVHYFEKILSLFPNDVSQIVWNEYYLMPHGPKEQEPNVLRVLWQYQAFRWGLMTIMATLLLYVLSTARRRQRMIPSYAKPANDSLDFVRTIGRLYYERRDHHNLAQKITAFFLEHVRNRYKIINPAFDEAFIKELHEKSGHAYAELKKLVDFMQYIETYTFITEQELARFYQQLHLFYQNTHGTLV